MSSPINQALRTNLASQKRDLGNTWAPFLIHTPSARSSNDSARALLTAQIPNRRYFAAGLYYPRRRAQAPVRDPPEKRAGAFSGLRKEHGDDFGAADDFRNLSRDGDWLRNRPDSAPLISYVARSPISRTSPPPLPTAVVCRSIAHHATTMFFPHFVGDA